MNELALFSGCGGGILGAKLLGWRTVCAVELDPFRCERLAQRQNEGLLPPFPIWNGDISLFDGRPWRGFIDVVSGGFPCQDISCANPNAEGITGARSGLWKEYFRLIREVGPSLILVENSPMLTSRGLDVVLSDLASLGYDAQWGVLGADDLGGFHKRERIFIVGHANQGELARQRLSLGCRRSSDSDSAGAGQTNALGHSDQARLEGHAGNVDGRDQSGRLAAQPARSLADAGLRLLADSPETRHAIGIRASHPANESGSGEGRLQQLERCDGAVADTDEGLRDGRTEDAGREALGGNVAGWISAAVGDGHEVDDDRSGHASGPVHGQQSGAPDLSGGYDCLWRDFQLLECKDGKRRAVKPGLCGVAYGVADRLERIAAVGDGQVPVVVSAAYQLLSELIDYDNP